jgi:hypothetical protein
MKKLPILALLSAAALSFSALAESSGLTFYPGAMLGKVDLSANWPSGDRSATDFIVGVDYQATGLKFRPRAEVRWLNWGSDVGSFGNLDGWSIGAGVSFDVFGNNTVLPYALVTERELADLRTTGVSLGLDYRLTKDAALRVEYQRSGEVIRGGESIKPSVFSMGIVWR